MKSIILIIAVLLLGCDDTPYKEPEAIGNYTSQSVKVYCDLETNLEYLVYNSYRSGGITSRYDTNGSLKTCQ